MPGEREREATSRVGMIIFLGSWAMMFGALFFTYVMLRLRSQTWPPAGVHVPVLAPAVNTALMLLSEGALVVAGRRVRAGRAGDVYPWLAGAIGLGTAFVLLQAATWLMAWAGGVLPSSGALGAIFWLLTVFHAVHVLVGLGLLVWLVPSAARRPHERRSQARLGLVSMFWHFVGIAWVLIWLAVFVG